MWKITPLIVAYGPRREKSRFTYLFDFGQKVDIPYVSWLLQNQRSGMNVLVDAGCSKEDYIKHIRGEDRGPLMLAGEKFDDVVDVKPLKDALAEHQLTYDDIDILIQTHLDWDHCMNTRHFKKSKILLQKKEWDALPPHPFFKGTFAPDYIYEEIGNLNVEMIDGDYKVADGLELIVTPGHSVAGQSVVVDTAEGRYIIAGMCTLRDNFYPSEEVQKLLGYDIIPTGMHYDPLETIRSMRRMLEIAGPNVLPFHDSAVWNMGTIG